jgi:hypothetical protein
MTDPYIPFMSLVDQFCQLEQEVSPGKMMSSPALKYNDKVFLFNDKKTLCFRLGPHFDAKKFGLKKPKLLSPFKTRAPLKGWYIVGENESHLWEALAHKALTFTKTL